MLQLFKMRQRILIQFKANRGIQGLWQRVL